MMGTTRVYTVKLATDYTAVQIEAFEMDVVDGALAFSTINHGGYVAGFAPGAWVSVTSEEKKR